jgi:hypothetical protein
MVVDFVIQAGAVYSGQVTIPDNDGTCTLPMVVFDALKTVAEEHPEVHGVKAMSISAAVFPEKREDLIGLCEHESLKPLLDLVLKLAKFDGRKPAEPMVRAARRRIRDFLGKQKGGQG